jgi:hypothetical protein
MKAKQLYQKVPLELQKNAFYMNDLNYNKKK